MKIELICRLRKDRHRTLISILKKRFERVEKKKHLPGLSPHAAIRVLPMIFIFSTLLNCGSNSSYKKKIKNKNF